MMALSHKFIQLGNQNFMRITFSPRISKESLPVILPGQYLVPGAWHHLVNKYQNPFSHFSSNNRPLNSGSYNHFIIFHSLFLNPPIAIFWEKHSFVSVEVHLEELLLGVGEPELEVEGAPLWIEQDVEESLAALGLQLHQVLLVHIVLLHIVLQ